MDNRLKLVTILSNAASAIVNLLTNGNMEAGDPPSSWTALNSATLDSAADERTGGSGAACLSVANGAAAAGYAQQAIAASPGQEITVTAYVRRVNTNPLVSIVDGSGILATSATYSSTSWGQVTVTATLVSGTPGVRLRNTNSTLGLESRFDDVIAYVSG